MIVVASVSCIFDIGSPQVRQDLAVPLAVGKATDPETIIARLADIGYKPTDTTLAPRRCRVRRHYVEVLPPYENCVYRIEVRDRWPSSTCRLVDADALVDENDEPKRKQ